MRINTLDLKECLLTLKNKNTMPREFEMSKELTEIDLYKIFGSAARYIKVENIYYIYFNGKDLSADTPKELMDKFVNEYNDYKNK